jgi:hypothetical protein
MSRKNKRNVNSQSRALEKTKSFIQKAVGIRFVSSLKLVLAITTIMIMIWLGFHFGSNDYPARSGQLDQSRSTVVAFSDENTDQPAMENAKIFFPETTYDFGTVAQNSSVSHTFVVKNTGEAPLELIKVKASCGCTAAVLTKADIPSGGEGEINVTFKTGEKRGQHKQTITVTSNDPDNSTTKLYIIANVKVLFGFETSLVDFGMLQKDEKAKQSVNFVTQGLKGIEITELKSSSEYITAKVITSESTAKSEDKIAIEICLLPGFPKGRFGAQITAKLNNDSPPGATLAVTGVIIDDIEVSPESIKFSAGNDTKQPFAPPFMKVLIINHSETQKLGIEGIRDQQNRFEFSLNTIQEGEEYEIVVTPKDIKDLKEYFRGTVVVSTNIPTQKEISIPYTIVGER